MSTSLRAPTITRRLTPLLAVALLALAACSPAQASHATTSPTQTPTAPLTTPTRAPASQPPWLMGAAPQLAGQAINWVQTTYTLTPGSPDPGNGQVIHASVWEQLDANGMATTFSARYTLPDGALYQWVYESAQTNLTIYGPVYRAALGTALPTPVDSAELWCVKVPQYSASALADRAPEYADAAKIGATGYQKRVGAPTEPLPDTPLLPYASNFLNLTIPSPASVQIWSRNIPLANGVDHATVETASDGRVVVTSDRTVNAQGQTVSETWSAIGPIHAYMTRMLSTNPLDPPSVPASC